MSDEKKKPGRPARTTSQRIVDEFIEMDLVEQTQLLLRLQDVNYVCRRHSSPETGKEAENAE
jgi:hypothetical protein